MRDAWSSLLDGHSVTWDERYSTDEFIDGDLATLVGALTNLVDNAVGVGGSNVALRVIVASLDGTLRVSIVDNGPGMDAAMLERARQPFVSGRIGGTGLGLSIVDGVTKAHGGRFVLESSVGAGYLRDHRTAAGGRPVTKPGFIIANSVATQRCFNLAERVSRTDVSVLISGESGTGKEVVARFIHDRSSRATGAFIAINCAAIPEQMLEAILFGHEKGAFTGAHQMREGKFELANGGTLLLDEISEMPVALQAKLLRVLQERELERVGGKRTIAVDVRVIATTNRDLKANIAAGTFREDLFYRLSVFPLHLEPLRARRHDIAPLARTLSGEARPILRRRVLVAGRTRRAQCARLARQRTRTRKRHSTRAGAVERRADRADRSRVRSQRRSLARSPASGSRSTSGC